MRIVPLDINNLDSASRLADDVFSYVRPPLPSVAFRASLDPVMYRTFQKLYNIERFSYWVAINELDCNVIGTTGLYELLEDQEDASWLGWFCVSPDVRGQKIGQRLLDFSIQLATILGKKYLRLYTSAHHREIAAQGLYEKNSFHRVEMARKTMGRSIFYREKQLIPTIHVK